MVEIAVDMAHSNLPCQASYSSRLRIPHYALCQTAYCEGIAKFHKGFSDFYRHVPPIVYVPLGLKVIPYFLFPIILTSIRDPLAHMQTQ